MDENTIRTTTPSQLVNIKQYLLVGVSIAIIIIINVVAYVGHDLLSIWLVLPVIVPMAWAFWCYLVVKNTQYKLTPERLLLKTGVINLVHNEVELYRIKKHILEQPWYLRLFGLGNLVLGSSDKTETIIVLTAIHHGQQWQADIRNYAEICRQKRRVSELDIA